MKLPKRPRSYCEKKWCGCGPPTCSKASYDRALKQAVDIATQLGSWWEIRMSHNMGWHASVWSDCRRFKVYANEWKEKVEWYTAFFGEAGFVGGRWAENGASPSRALDRVIQVAQMNLAEVGARLLTLPRYKGRRIDLL